MIYHIISFHINLISTIKNHVKNISLVSELHLQIGQQLIPEVSSHIAWTWTWSESRQGLRASLSPPALGLSDSTLSSVVPEPSFSPSFSLSNYFNIVFGHLPSWIVKVNTRQGMLLRPRTRDHIMGTISNVGPLTWDYFQRGTINVGPFPTWDH